MRYSVKQAGEIRKIDHCQQQGGIPENILMGKP
jgi:hypothetical protein